MNKHEIKEVAWISDEQTTRPIRGVILVFHGLGSPELRKEPNDTERRYAAAGGLVVFPYYGPWSWMNRLARQFVDDLVASIYAEFDLDATVPLISTGGSMGGFSSLVYTRYARKPVSRCLAVYPVTDLKHHFGERPDLPRTIRSAYLGYPGDFDSFFVEQSPLAQAEQMPRIPYLVVHGDVDLSVNKEAHSDRFVAAMRAAEHQVDYIEVPGMGHGSNVPPAVTEAQTQFVLDGLVG